MVILSTETYNEVVQFIRNQNGLPIDDESDLQKEFPNITAATLNAIMAREWQERIKKSHSHVSSRIKKFIQE